MKSSLFLGLLAVAITVSAQDWAKAKLEKSPRHQEWVEVKNGTRTVHSFVVYPEVKDKAAVVIVIHENKGLTDWVRSAADQFAAAGYIAIAPDLLSGASGNAKTSDFKDADAATAAIYKLPADQVTADLNAVAKHAASIPAANGKIAAAGFCWGGGQSFRFPTNNKDVKAALVFYGTGSDKEEDIKRINCPVYGFYGGADNRINATIPKSKEMMKAAGKTYEPVIYEGAG
ncbi:MAG TPA: dienelactone hydrolase family protein, partial [Candidatus Limnocylindria bacterium]|nr:dienelactone hydrolase family protein [Candidatus Limnocylindria bacterium]